MVLALGTCCWWSFAARIQDEVRPTTQATGALVDITRDASTQQIASMGAACLSLIGGLTLCVLGLGVQHGKRNSGRWLKWSCGLIALYFWWFLIMSVFAFPFMIARVILGVAMALAWTGLFLLVGAAVHELAAMPAMPADSQWTQRDEDDLRRGGSPH